MQIATQTAATKVRGAAMSLRNDGEKSCQKIQTVETFITVRSPFTLHFHIAALFCLVVCIIVYSLSVSLAPSLITTSPLLVLTS